MPTANYEKTPPPAQLELREPAVAYSAAPARAAAAPWNIIPPTNACSDYLSNCQNETRKEPDEWDAERFDREVAENQRYFESLGYTEESFYAMVAEEIKSHWGEKNELEAHVKK